MMLLHAATGDAAEFLGISDTSGTIEKGKRADVVLLDAMLTRAAVKAATM